MQNIILNGTINVCAKNRNQSSIEDKNTDGYYFR